MFPSKNVTAVAFSNNCLSHHWVKHRLRTNGSAVPNCTGLTILWINAVAHGVERDNIRSLFSTATDVEIEQFKVV
jgi:hypothetical protein